MLQLDYIFESFRKLDSATDKVEFLKNLRELNLSYELNYDNLILAWERIAELELPET